MTFLRTGSMYRRFKRHVHALFIASGCVLSPPRRGGSVRNHRLWVLTSSCPSGLQGCGRLGRRLRGSRKVMCTSPGSCRRRGGFRIMIDEMQCRRGFSLAGSSSRPSSQKSPQRCTPAREQKLQLQLHFPVSLPHALLYCRKLGAVLFQTTFAGSRKRSCP